MTQFYVLWLVQALTECLPISSSGHVALVQAYLNTSSVNTAITHLSQKAYLLAHIPALIAGAWYTAGFWWPLVLSLLAGQQDGLQAVMFFGVTTVCAVTGYVVHRMRRLDVPLWIGFTLTALLLMLISACHSHGSLTLSLYHAGIIGVTQALVFVPGVSRLATVTLVGCLLGYSPYVAYCMAWLVHLPLMAGGMLIAARDQEPLPAELSNTLLGLVAVTALACLLVYLVGWLVVIHKLWFFSCYLCIPIASAWYKRREIV